MYLFSRQMRLARGRIDDGMSWAVGQCERATRISGLQVSLYTQVFSPQLGTIAFTAFVPDLASLEEANDKLMVETDFLAGLREGADFVESPVDDLLFDVVHGEPDPGRDVRYVTGVRAVCAAGQLSRGLGLGVEIAERAEGITGTPTMFLAGATGSYGTVAWISGHESVQALDASRQALAADADWLAYLDREIAGVYFESPEATQQTFYRRVV
jgi:hypothetical protein